MRKKAFLKRISALFLALALTVGDFSPFGFAASAVDYYIRFYDPITKTNSSNQTLVEGASATIQANLPDSYEFSVIPFAVRKSEGNVSQPIGDISTVFQIVTNTKGSNYSLTPQVLAGAASSVEYTLEALYTANITDGTALVVSSDTDPNVFAYALDVVSTTPIPITADSTITFDVASDQGEDDGTISFGTVKTATGYFSGKYEGQVVTAGAITGTGSNRYIPIRIITTSDDNPQHLEFNLYLAGVPASRRFAKDTSFTVSFTRQTISPLIATVITRQKAVDDTLSSVLQNTTTSGVTTTGEGYIQIADTETLQSIENSFAVLSNVHRYNIDVDLEWEWAADNPVYQGYVDIQRTTNPKKKAVTIIRRPEEDLTGNLLLKAAYTYTDGTGTQTVRSEQGVIPIRIYGTGKPPMLSPMQTYTGVQNGDDVIATLTDFPQTVNMDVYNGDPPYAPTGLTLPTAPTAPYKMTSTVFFGDGRGRADRAVITQNSGGGELELYVEGSAVAYKYGTDIVNVGSYKAIEIIARKEGQTNLTISFYNSSNELMSSYTVTHNFYINDTTPSADGTLASLQLIGVSTDDKKTVFNKVYPSGIIDYGFSPEVNAYNISLPNCVKEITLTPRLTTNSGAKQTIDFSSQNAPVPNNTSCTTIPLEVEKSYTLRVTVTAQDGSTNSYTLKLLRQGPSGDATLSAFEAYADTDTATDLIEGFSPATKSYTITVPYSVTKVEARAIPNSPWVTLTDNKTVVWSSNGERSVSLKEWLDSFFFSSLQTNATFVLNRPVAVGGVFGESTITTISATVLAEDGTTSAIYTLNVISLPPSNNNNLGTLTVANDAGTAFAFEYGVTFDPEVKDYLLRIPYSTSSLVITAQAQDTATSLGMALDAAGYSYARVPTTYKPGMPTVFTIKNMGPVSFTGTTDPNLEPFVFKFTVTAESENVTNPPYTIEIQRNDPSDDNSLKSLVLTDQDGGAINNFAFNSEQLSYELEVPYLVSKLKVTPTAASELAKITVDGNEISLKRPDYTTKTLTAGSATTITVIVTAENFSTRTYTIKVTREKPSTESRLASLTAGTLKLDPKFNPNTLKYKITIPEGTNGIAFTPTAVSPYATITVENVAVKSGAASQTITPTDDITKMYIVVTAQDGKTKTTYVVSVTDENLIVKSDNADLYSLAFLTGDLNPKFQPSIVEYEVYVKADTYSVEIIPKTANRHAKMTVFDDSREVGDYEGNYFVSLFDDETEITIEVESQDKSQTNEYIITVYRGDEEKQGIYNPINADEVDFTVPDPIRIDIAKYPLVQGEIFNTLKQNFPTKSIIFSGNDYTLTIKGSDIETLVPNTEYFDLSISFSPPNEEKIWDTITSLDSDNDSLEPVYVHFNHHGTLPAPMKLTLSLGQEYRNRELFWNYFNEERDRIDYYGFVLSNAKGTFSLPLTHMSTYIVTEEKIIDAEDKVGGLAGYFTDNSKVSLTSYYTSGKANPNTGSGVK